MSGYINSIRKGIGKLLGKGGDDVPPPKKDGDVPPEKDEPTPHPLDPSPLTAEESSFNIPRTKKFVEGMQEEPPDNIMSMGRPDDGNINLRLMQEDPKIKQATELLNLSQDRFRETTVRQKQTNLKTIEKSEDLQVLRRALNKGPDPSYTAAEVVALGRLNRDVTEILTENVQKFIKSIENDTISQSEMLALSHLEDVAIAAQQKWGDSGTVTGRALQARNALSTNPTSKLYQEAAKGVTDLKGGRLVLKERLKLYAEGKSVEDVMQRISTTAKERVWKEIFFWRYNFMLSSIRTGAANMFGGAAVSLNERFVVKPLTVGFNKGEQGIRWMLGKSAKDLSPDEAMVWAEIRGDWTATRDGLGRGLAGARDIIKGRAIKDGKFFNEIGTRYDVNDVPQGDNVASSVKRKAGLVTRSLEATDAIFRGLNYQQELSRLARRRSLNTMPSKEKADALYDELVSHPPPDMIHAAKEYAKYTVFANDPNLYSNVFGTITKGAAWLQQNSKVAQIIMPFVRVVGNIAIYGKNHGMAPLSTKLWQDIVGKDPVRRAEALARFSESAGIGMILHQFWEDGHITGMGHPDREARATAARAGYPPNSIKVDGEWYSITRLDPISLSLTLWATMFENMEANDNDPITGIIDTTLAMGQLLQDRAMLVGIADAFEVMSGRGGANTKADFIANLTLIPVMTQPGIVRDLRNMADPVRRQMEAEDTVGGWIDRAQMRFQNAWPGLSDDLPPKRDWRGDIVVNQSHFLVRGMLPVTRVDSLTDNSTLALLQFDVDIPKPAHTLSLPIAGIKLNLLGMDQGRGWAYNKYVEMIGKEQAIEVEAIVNSKGFKADWKDAVKNGQVADGLLYEELQEELMSAMSRGRKFAKLDFLDWLDKRETIPGKVINEETGEREKIAVPEVFDLDRYPDIDLGILRGEIDIRDTKIFTKKGTTTLPAVQKTINESVEF